MSGIQEMGDKDNDYETVPFPNQLNVQRGQSPNGERGGYLFEMAHHNFDEPELIDQQQTEAPSDNVSHIEQQSEAPSSQEEPRDNVSHIEQQSEAPSSQEAPRDNVSHIEQQSEAPSSEAPRDNVSHIEQQSEEPSSQEVPRDNVSHIEQQTEAPSSQEAPNDNMRNIEVVGWRTPIIRSSTTTMLPQNRGKLSSDDDNSS